MQSTVTNKKREREREGGTLKKKTEEEIAMSPAHQKKLFTFTALQLLPIHNVIDVRHGGELCQTLHTAIDYFLFPLQCPRHSSTLLSPST